MKIIIAIILLWAAQLNAQIGIGTVNPSANAALDVSSTNKGFMLPRIADTTTVSNPTAGLMIFNMQAKALAFHDGARWNNLSANSVVATDSITYTVMGITPGTFRAISVSNGIVHDVQPGSSVPSFAEVTFIKPLDANSVVIAEKVVKGPAGPDVTFEIKSYTPGAATPNFSIKITKAIFTSYQVSLGDSLYESVSTRGETIGYKNWITNTGFSVRLSTLQISAY